MGSEIDGWMGWWTDKQRRSLEVTTWQLRAVSKLMDGTQRELREMGLSREERKKGGWIDVQTERLTDEGNR